LRLLDQYTNSDARHRVEGGVEDHEDQKGHAAPGGRRSVQPVNQAPHDEREKAEDHQLHHAPR
jgi:hypothetical protein